MDADKVLEEEEEEEKEQFFSDLVATEEGDEEDEEDAGDEPMDDADDATGSESGTTPAAPSGGPSVPQPAAGVAERRALVGASPYVAPFTPLSSPNQPKTPSSVSVAQRHVGGKKPQLVPMKNGGGAGFAAGGAGAGGASKVIKDDVVAHLPDALVDALVGTVQTLDKLILGVEDFKADQLGFLTDKVNAYVDLLKKVDAAGAGYDALIPLEVLQMLNGEDNTNPELFTKAQLEKCQEESERAAGKVDTLEMLKRELETGFAEL